MHSPEKSADRIWTIPNLVTLVRLLGVVLFWKVLVVDDNVALAAWLIFIIGWTDWIDGYLARRLNQVSELGKALDPIADRLMIGSAIVGGLIVGVVPLVIGIPLLLREAIMGGLALYLVYRKVGTLPVRQMGKWATFILYGSIPSFYLASADFLTPLTLPAAWISGVVGLVLYWWVMFQYIGDARSRLAGVESLTNPVLGREEN